MTTPPSPRVPSEAQMMVADRIARDEYTDSDARHTEAERAAMRCRFCRDRDALRDEIASALAAAEARGAQQEIDRINEIMEALLSLATPRDGAVLLGALVAIRARASAGTPEKAQSIPLMAPDPSKPFRYVLDGLEHFHDEPTISGMWIKVGAPSWHDSWSLYLESEDGQPDREVVDSQTVDIRRVRNFYSVPPACM